jgi:orotidine-5'-phosphate decarboxylase
MKFTDKLLNASRKNKSWLCIGLDPDPELMPRVDVPQFNKAIIEATSDLVCAYKPNLAFYEALGTEGLAILEKTVKYTPADIPVIGDAKRGDIGIHPVPNIKQGSCRFPEPSHQRPATIRSSGSKSPRMEYL